MNLRKPFCFVLVFLVPTLASFPMDLDQYMNLVMESHPFFLKEELTVGVEKIYREALLPRYGWEFSLGPQYSIAGGQIGPEFLEDLSHAGVMDARMQRSYANGLYFSVSASAEYSASIPMDPDSYQNPFRIGFRLSLSWPLGKNWARLARLGYDSHAFTIEYREVETQENRENFLVEPTLLFINWVTALEMVEISRKRVELEEEQLESTNQMLRLNQVEKIDILRCEDAIRTAQQSIFEFESLAKSIQAELSVLADSDDVYTEEPEYDFYSFIELPAAAEAVVTGITNNRLKKLLLILIE